MNKIPRCFDCFGYRYNHCVVLAEEYSNSNECPFYKSRKDINIDEIESDIAIYGGRKKVIRKYILISIVKNVNIGIKKT